MAQTLDNMAQVKRKRGINKRRAECHPDKPHQAKGLCKSCYLKHLMQVNPTFRANHKRLCYEWQKRNKVAKRESWQRWAAKGGNLRSTLKRKYGTTVEHVNSLKAKQGNQCAICDEVMKMPHIDHDHKTGQVRALLCFRCNSGLGSFNDNPDKMRKAALYIEHWLSVNTS